MNTTDIPVSFEKIFHYFENTYYDYLLIRSGRSYKFEIYVTLTPLCVIEFTDKDIEFENGFEKIQKRIREVSSSVEEKG